MYLILSVQWVQVGFLRENVGYPTNVSWKGYWVINEIEQREMQRKQNFTNKHKVWISLIKTMLDNTEVQLSRQLAVLSVVFVTFWDPASISFFQDVCNKQYWVSHSSASSTFCWYTTDACRLLTVFNFHAQADDFYHSSDNSSVTICTHFLDTAHWKCCISGNWLNRRLAFTFSW